MDFILKWKIRKKICLSFSCSTGLTHLGSYSVNLNSLLVNEHVQKQNVRKYLNVFMCIKNVTTNGGPYQNLFTSGSIKLNISVVH